MRFHAGCDAGLVPADRGVDVRVTDRGEGQSPPLPVVLSCERAPESAREDGLDSRAHVHAHTKRHKLATAWPPPMHIDARPYSWPPLTMFSIRRAVMIAPVAPMG